MHVQQNPMQFKSRFTKFTLLILTLMTFQLSLVACGGDETATTTTETENTSSPNNSSATDPDNSEQADSSSLTADWVDFTTESGALSIKFPGQPVTEQQVTPSELGDLDLSMTSYTDEVNQRFYIVSSIDYPVDPADYDVEQGLESAKNGAAQNSGSTIISDEPTDRFGIPGKKLLMNTTQAGQELTLRAEIYIDPQGPTLHQMIMVVEGDQVDFPEANAFFDSAEIAKL